MIGKITALSKPTLRDNEAVWEVTPSQNNQYLKRVVLLPPRVTTITDAIVHTFYGFFVKEMLLTRRGSTKYLTTVVDSHKNTSDWNQIEISPSDCTRLILEAISLVEQLHRQGCQLACQLELFLQDLPARVGFVSLDPADSRKNKLRRSREKETREYFSREEVAFLSDFCQALLKRSDGDGGDNQSHLGKLMENLEKATKSDRRESCEHLRKTLCEFRVEQTQWSLSCSLNPFDKSLQVEIKDLADKTTSTYYEKGAISASNKHDSQMTSDELFFLLSTRNKDQLKI